MTSAAIGPDQRAGTVRRLIGIADVALLLGMSVPTIERMDASGRIPAPRRIGRANRWDSRELNEWLSRPKPDGQLLGRKEWGAVWQQIVKSGRN
jgi:excisionase family DNA binding protein